ncbi:hypothetical protein [Nostoc sp.]
MLSKQIQILELKFKVSDRFRRAGTPSHHGIRQIVIATFCLL